ncbi:MAG: hypothetical protein U0M19_01245 [Caecibacter sp.]|nr:hypothetical protein [Caecibacter sp.]
MKRIVMLCVCLVLAFAMPILAKDSDKGVEVAFPGWGIVTLPSTVQFNEGTQSMAMAQQYGNDMIRMCKEIYPVEPIPYQLVSVNRGVFQYGYMLRYTVDISQIQAALDTSKTSKNEAYLQDIGYYGKSKKEKEMMYTDLVSRANAKLESSLPTGFRVEQPFTAKKIKGTTFYESTVVSSQYINQSIFKETLKIIAYVHGRTVEIALIMGHVEDNAHLVSTMVNALEGAKKLPKK